MALRSTPLAFVAMLRLITTLTSLAILKTAMELLLASCLLPAPNASAHTPVRL
jgi:hypothetical protein